MRIRQAIYPYLQSLIHFTARREKLREIRFQRQMRYARPEDFLKYSHERAVEYANYMVSASKAYAAKLAAAGIRLPIDTSPETWLKLPTLRKSDFQQASEDWYVTGIAPEDIIWTTTSGSTGQPYRFPQQKSILYSEAAASALYFQSVERHVGGRPAIFKMAAPRISLKRRLARKLMGNEALYFSAVDFRREQTPEIIATLNRNHVGLLQGYAYTIVVLAEETLRRNLSIHIPLIHTFGEGTTEEQRKTIERAFGGKAYSDYSGSEAMMVGFQCTERNGYHLDFSRFKIEILDGDRPVKPGETGEIVVTNFENLAMPFVRYRMGDLGTLADPNESCPCGVTYPRLSAIQGRVGDVIYTPDGKPLSSLYFSYLFDFSDGNMLEYKIIQKSAELVEVLWIPAGEGSEKILPLLEKQFAEYTGGTMHIQWTAVKEIPADASGKRRQLIPLK